MGAGAGNDAGDDRRQAPQAVKARLDPAAEAEVVEALRWYLDNSGPRRADAFEREIDAAILLLLRQPALGTVGPGAVRAWSIPGYPYTLHYRVEGEALRILAVAHQRRRPGYWRGRT